MDDDDGDTFLTGLGLLQPQQSDVEVAVVNRASPVRRPPSPIALELPEEEPRSYSSLLKDVVRSANEEDPLEELRRLIKRTRGKLDNQRAVLDNFRHEVKQLKHGGFDDDRPALAGPRSTSSMALRNDRSTGQLGNGVSRPKSMTSLHGERSMVRRSDSQTTLAAGAAVVGVPGGMVTELLRRKGQTPSLTSSTAAISDLPKAKRPPSRGRTASRANQQSLLKARGGGSALLEARR